jgi:hypothetical protein
MLRFQPDGWLEGLLRPFLMMEPGAGVYFEEMAPDWRFAAVAAFFVVALVAHRGRLALGFGQRQLLLGWLAVFYLWTFAIGNGRYFMAGLLLAGPMLVLAWRQLPGTAWFRGALLILAAGLQLQALMQTYTPNNWGLIRWAQGDALDIQDSPIRHQPAVFVSTTAISYSILVPRFHRDARWTNVSGQQDIRPGMPEYERLHRLLAGPLPRFAVMPVATSFAEPDGQPQALVKRIYADLLAPQGLRPTDEACHVLRSGLAPGPRDMPMPEGSLRGFWFCPLAYTPPSSADAPPPRAVPADIAAAFDAVERHCPRFFPPGHGKTRVADDTVSRHYDTDTRLLADYTGNVYFKYYRALNPTRIGSVNDIASGRFGIPCDKLPGRHVPAWQTD